jgi:hypothetical protein
VSPLERWYRRLLRAYPADYRAGRADEMLGTLLETAVRGQRRPGARESAALIGGGIRARAARNAGLPELASLRLAAMLGCAACLGGIDARPAFALAMRLAFFGVTGAGFGFTGSSFVFSRPQTLTWLTLSPVVALPLLVRRRLDVAV